MYRWTTLVGVPLCCAATLASAQAPVRPADPIFVRAQSLVSDGNGVAGRALIDSVLAKTPASSQLYPQALFWRATLAANASDAESDYKHIVVDYPLAPQAEDALLRLAQLELARGDRDGALGHLQRIPRDYPRSKSLARANYWTARVLFEKNDVPNACVANTNALSQVDASEIELKNQIQYQGQRCLTAAVVAVAPPTTGTTVNPTAVSPAAPPTSSPAVTIPSTASTTPAATSPNASSATSTPPRPVVSAPTEKPPVAVDVVPPPAASSSAPKSVVTAERPKPPTEVSVSKPSTVDPPKPPKAVASKGSGYSVQVAAYSRKPEADKLTATLNKRGYSARVDGSVAPFRVRIGRYATENEAEIALKKIKASHMDGFVVRAPER
jgi:cell division protein FtsN